MPLSNREYQMIIASYDLIRQQDETERNERVQDIYRRLPRVAEIDQKIERFSLDAMQRYLRTHEDAEKIMNEARSEVEALQDERSLLLREAGYDESDMEIRYQCSLCRDTGYIGSEPCRCLRQKITAVNQEHSNLGRLLREQTFERFDLMKFSDVRDPREGHSPRENMQRILNVIHQDLEAAEKDLSIRYYIYGSAGTGKTYLCSCIANAVLEMGYSVYYVSAYDLCRITTDHRYRRDEGDPAYGLLFDSDLLIVDDLGTEAVNAMSIADLFNCINQRLNQEKSMVISSNLSLSQLSKSYTDRFTSRIMGSFRRLACYGEDLRWSYLKK